LSQEVDDGAAGAGAGVHRRADDRALRAAVDAQRHHREANGRAAIYLSTVSSALVAFGFLAQVSGRLTPVVAAVLPALLILGEFTFVRLADTAIENVVSLQRIQRIHAYYRSLVPEAEQFFQATPDDEMTAAVESTGVPRTPLGLLYTAASMIAAVNSVLGGVGLALLCGLGGLGPGPAVVVGVAGALALYGLHLWYGVRRNAQVGLRPPPLRTHPR
jgi:hypothetical protein